MKWKGIYLTAEKQQLQKQKDNEKNNKNNESTKKNNHEENLLEKSESYFKILMTNTAYFLGTNYEKQLIGNLIISPIPPKWPSIEN